MKPEPKRGLNDRASKWSGKCTNEPGNEQTDRQNTVHPTYKDTAKNKPGIVLPTYKRKNEMRSRKNFCLGKAVRITYSECVSVSLVIHHAMRMSPIVICGLSGSTFFLHYLRKETILGEKLPNIKCRF